ncbi:MAG: hypothetical protein U9N49_02315, partial [Campylobacterota bacterium]|nr:hypothetical protein [Campylobacterota bacterium]
NKNMVVSKLVKISTKELNASLDEIEVVSNITKDNYDLIIVDESSLTPLLQSSLKQLVVKHSLLLTNSNNDNNQEYDFELKKPFLPQDLTSLILQFTQESQPQEVSQQATITSNHNDLLEQIISLEPKKIQEILAGAKVTITIEFPKEK